jgi:hypothetical protein
MPLYPQSVMSQGACYNSLFFHCFHFRFTFESIKKLGSASRYLKNLAINLRCLNQDILKMPSKKINIEGKECSLVLLFFLLQMICFTFCP